MSKDKNKSKRSQGMPLPPSDMAKLRGMKLWVATPCYGGMLTDIYTASLLKMQNLFWHLGVEFYTYFVRNESNVCRARNECVAAFMGKGEGYTHFMFLDADIGFQADSVVRLLMSGKEVIAGGYRKKCQKEDYTVTFQEGKFDIVGGVCEVERAGAGFLMIQRGVFEKMMKHYPEMKYETFSHLLSEKERAFTYTFFENYYDENGIGWSEDYGFCNRWKNMGGKIHLDVTAKLDHLGSYVFEGDISKILMDYKS